MILNIYYGIIIYLLTEFFSEFMFNGQRSIYGVDRTYMSTTYNIVEEWLCVEKCLEDGVLRTLRLVAVVDTESYKLILWLLMCTYIYLYACNLCSTF